MATTAIEWTDATWNPVTGCTKVSPGCKNCYAETVANRFWGHQYGGRKFIEVRCHPERLEEPLRWRKPRHVFVNSMSDLFHEDVPDEFIDRVFAVMALAQQHTFQVLTKRPERMKFYLADTRRNIPVYNVAVAEFIRGDWAKMPGNMAHERSSGASWWPLPNVWLGVSAEDQATADERIPLLLKTPAAVRFVSLEPLLGPIDIAPYLWPTHWAWDSKYDTPEDAIRHGAYAERRRQALVSAQSRFLDWVIVGGESGPSARPCDVAWIRSIVQQCREAGVACFVKQVGSRTRGWCAGSVYGYSDDPNACDIYEASEGPPCEGACRLMRVGKGGDPAEWPEDLRVREFPELAR